MSTTGARLTTVVAAASTRQMPAMKERRNDALNVVIVGSLKRAERGCAIYAVNHRVNGEKSGRINNGRGPAVPKQGKRLNSAMS